MIGSDIFINSRKHSVNARGHLAHVKRPAVGGQTELKMRHHEGDLNLDKPSCIQVRALMAKGWYPDPHGGDIWLDALKHFESQTPLNFLTCKSGPLPPR